MKSEIEEERRLFYVAATRAREKLYLLNYSEKPTGKNKTSRVKSSIFLEEMKGKGCTRKTDQSFEEKREDARKQTMSGFAEGDPKYFRTGMPVHHLTYGDGIVVSKTLFFVNIRFACGGKVFPLK